MSDTGVSVEDMDERDYQPDPKVWPECTRCGMPYVLRRALSLSKGDIWAWMPDCEKPRSTCKGADAVLVTADGVVAS